MITKSKRNKVDKITKLKAPIITNILKFSNIGISNNFEEVKNIIE